MNAANLVSPAQDQTLRKGVRLRHGLAGLEAGVLGALLMCGWLMFASLLLRRSVWSVPNLFATVFYGHEAYANTFLRSSFSGLAFILIVYGALGILWGIVWQEKQHAFLRLIGALTGLAVYMVFFNLIWPHTTPLVSLYAPNRQLQVAHMLWGIMLAYSPRFARNIASANGTADSSPDVHEIRSGEVIL